MNEASLVTSVILATKRLGTNDKLAKEEGGPQRGDQGPATRRKARRRPSTQTRRTGQFATRLVRTMGQVKRKYMKSMKLVWGSSITKLWKIEQEGRARQAPQRPEETSSQPT